MTHWYEESFKDDYLLVYKHRSKESAITEIEQITHLLQITKDQLILDLCCGAGRHSIALANEGYHVVGVDLSKTLLGYAKSKANNLPIPFLSGDMRSLPFVNGCFHVVLNLFTSFGYFSKDEDNKTVLKEIQRVLNEKGRFLLDYMNTTKVRENLIPKSKREQDGSTIIEKRFIEGNLICKDIEIIDGLGSRHYKERVRMYSESEVKEMMKEVGLKVNTVYGDFNGELYHPESNRMIFVGEAELY